MMGGCRVTDDEVVSAPHECWCGGHDRCFLECIQLLVKERDLALSEVARLREALAKGQDAQGGGGGQGSKLLATSASRSGEASVLTPANPAAKPALRVPKGGEK